MRGPAIQIWRLSYGHLVLMAKRSINEILETETIMFGFVEEQQLIAALREARDVLNRLTASPHFDVEVHDDAWALLKKWDKHD